MKGIGPKGNVCEVPMFSFCTIKVRKLFNIPCAHTLAPLQEALCSIFLRRFLNRPNENSLSLSEIFPKGHLCSRCLLPAAFLDQLKVDPPNPRSQDSTHAQRQVHWALRKWRWGPPNGWLFLWSLSTAKGIPMKPRPSSRVRGNEGAVLWGVRYACETSCSP